MHVMSDCCVGHIVLYSNCVYILFVDVFILILTVLQYLSIL